jgi:hypothetical protein
LSSRVVVLAELAQVDGLAVVVVLVVIAHLPGHLVDHRALLKVHLASH